MGQMVLGDSVAGSTGVSLCDLFSEAQEVWTCMGLGRGAISEAVGGQRHGS